MASAIDDYLSRLDRQLNAGAETRAAILAEVRAHLEEAVESEEASGADRADAEARAIAAFGAPQTIGARFNRVHPIEWDRLRLVNGIAWGAVVSWVVWTLVTYPLLVWLTLQQGHLPGNPPGVFHDPTLDLLFYATPLAFGAFWVLAESALLVKLLWLVPFLLLYAAVPFVWGLRARQGWRPGLAFGLGVVVGFPWLLPAVATHWGAEGQGLQRLLVVLVIWLLTPFAILASWLGSRLRLMVARRASASPSRLRMPTARRLSPAVALMAAVTLVLVSLGAWSWTQAAAWAARPQSTVAQQLAAAQSVVPFRIRLPSWLPPGMAVAGVESAHPGCAACWVQVTFEGLTGATIALTEDDRIPPELTSFSPPNYQVSEGTGGSVHPVWWLGDDVQQWHQVLVDWADHGLWYALVTFDAFSPDQLKQIAASIPSS